MRVVIIMLLLVGIAMCFYTAGWKEGYIKAKVDMYRVETKEDNDGN